MTTLTQVKAVQDDSSHWYVIPFHLEGDFFNDLEGEDDFDPNDFDEKWGKYRTNGDLNNKKLYAYL